MPSKRTRNVVVAAVIVAAIAGSAFIATAAQSRTHDNITLTVDVFGDFGYKDLYAQYMASHPGITIKEDTQDYAPHHTALSQHLATGAGADDVEAVEVGFIAQFAAQPQNFVDLRQYGASSLKGNYPSWKYQQAVSSSGSVIGLGTDIGSLGICYRADLFKKAGLPSDPASVSKLWPTWQAFLATGQKFQAKAPKGVYFVDSGSNLYNAVVAQANPAYYDGD